MRLLLCAIAISATLLAGCVGQPQDPPDLRDPAGGADPPANETTEPGVDDTPPGQHPPGADPPGGTPQGEGSSGEPYAPYPADRP
ncbi:MAG TPA: hypothetical protein VM681_02865 [Candidatus Thermoplasmatota archaeon]|nr:hypothetical protein [Candidatus Thermoplasmatota archaeon]